MPLTVAVPAALPVTVFPETLAIEELLEEKLPPVKPAGAEAMLVPPTVIVEGVRVTVLLEVGQEGGVVTVTVSVVVPTELPEGSCPVTTIV